MQWNQLQTKTDRRHIAEPDRAKLRWHQCTTTVAAGKQQPCIYPDKQAAVRARH